VDAIFALQREALLANPLLDFGELLVQRRKRWGRPPLRRPAFGSGVPGTASAKLLANSCIPQVFGWENEISVLLFVANPVWGLSSGRRSGAS
jgi:hypothetical protein